MWCTAQQNGKDRCGGGTGTGTDVGQGIGTDTSLGAVQQVERGPSESIFKT